MERIIIQVLYKHFRGVGGSEAMLVLPEFGKTCLYDTLRSLNAFDPGLVTLVFVCCPISFCLSFSHRFYCFYGAQI